MFKIRPIVFFIFLSLCFSQVVSAKRAAPVEANPVDYKGVRFSAPAAHAGFVEAHDISTGEKIWEKKVYQIFYNPFLEKDVQDVYIASLQMGESELLIKDERGRYYRVKIPAHLLSEKKCSECIARPFDYKSDLFDPVATLLINVKSVDLKTGEVLVTAMDTRAPKDGLLYDWGDGCLERGYYHKTHRYKDKAKNYCLTVTAQYPTHKGEIQALIRFVPVVIKPLVLSGASSVEIPDHSLQLLSRLQNHEGWHSVRGRLSYFDDSFFNLTSRATAEYILSVASGLFYDLFDGDVVKENGSFKQVLLRDPKFKLMYALWYARPVAIVSGNYGFGGVIQYSSFFHEIAHNYVLNFPTDYYYGDKIAGPGSGFFSETMSQIMQHVVAYEIVNHYDRYGLSEDVAFDIKRRAINTMRNIRQGYEKYKAQGMRFCSWNDQESGPSEMESDTYMTIAYIFFVHAQNSGQDYLGSLKKMVAFLRAFNEDIMRKYDAGHDTTQASAFRATYMVAALSYVFCEDLRGEFRNLNFPIDDAAYIELLSRFERQKGGS